jgi:FMN phosphatase YigB (HAD superfamily)
MACERLGVTPEVCVFLDDIGSNLKTARQMGITTIKVDTPDVALRELEAFVELELLAD